MTQHSVVKPPLPAPRKRVEWGSLPGSSVALALASVVARRKLVLAITRDSRSAQALTAAIEAFGQPVLPFPDWETLPYDQFAPHPDIISDRISTLYRLRGETVGALVLPAQALAQVLAPPAYIHGQGLVLKPGDKWHIEEERRRLEKAGYRCVRQVNDRGEFAVRGALMDVFPMGAQWPIRIELFDSEVETLRTFDPETQLSRERQAEISLLPAREYPFAEDAAEAFRVAFRNRFDVNLQKCTIYQDAKAGIAGSGIEYYLPLFFQQRATLIDYLPANTLLVLEGGSEAALEQTWTQLNERYESHRHDVQRPLLSPAEIADTPQQTRDRLAAFASITFDSAAQANPVLDIGPAPTIDVKDAAQAPLLTDLINQTQGPVVITAPSAGRLQLLGERLTALGHSPAPLASLKLAAASPPGVYGAVASLDHGFVSGKAGHGPSLVVLAERQLLGHRAPVQRAERRTTRSPEAIISNLSDLEIGAPVVHEDYGVGRYLGLTHMSAAGIDAEFLAVEYAGGDRIYVPVASLYLISRYTGASPDNAPLHKLGGDQWQRIRKKAAEKVVDVAAELLDLYARREARQGRAMVIDDALYQEFCSGFPFEETGDQATAIDAVLEDLASDQPMDRVVCGDVGFGKTEVALRAAFVAVQAGYQVVLLVPTTLLAQQHERNFADRFANWPIHIASLSRFKSRTEASAILNQLTEGKLDIVIGTHRLLQKDVKVKNLGLLIVDEEQRFGVRQKERIKQLRAEVDVLTLTATPIPRTLNMAFSGMRDLSIIATPPAHRMAVKTYVGQRDNGTLRDTVQRELQRGGQIYFLHNEVQSIDRMARELGEMFPYARIGVAHGQMAERELENVMLAFYQQEYNLLVCSTIIENGIDVATANTIIINRADRFGLAQLHQLRGRVGRSHHRAYAYLMVPPPKAMTSDARKRLDALESLDELGMGFTLATHDLEIRGAGELLGDEQSGQITQVGFELYMQLLERAVKAIRNGQLPDADSAPESQHCEVDLSLPALIPDSYLPDVHTRLVLYKRIAGAADGDALDAIQTEMIDRFGLLPPAAKNLFTVSYLKLQCEPLGIRQMHLHADGGRIRFIAEPAIEPIVLIKMVQSQPSVYAFAGQQELKLAIDLPSPEDRVNAATQLLGRLMHKSAA